VQRGGGDVGEQNATLEGIAWGVLLGLASWTLIVLLILAVR
jgi:hypothetical protein